MSTKVKVPGLGVVGFPASMTMDEIKGAIQRNLQKRLHQTPAMQPVTDLPQPDQHPTYEQMTAPAHTQTGMPSMFDRPTADEGRAVWEVVKETGREYIEPTIKLPDLNVGPNDLKWGQPGTATPTMVGRTLGAYDLARGAVEFLSSPAAATAVLGGPIAQAATAVGLGAHMASMVPEAAQQAGETSVEGNPIERHRAYVGLGGQIGFVPMLLMGGAKLGHKTLKEPHIREWQEAVAKHAELKKHAPLTAEATQTTARLFDKPESTPLPEAQSSPRATRPQEQINPNKVQETVPTPESIFGPELVEGSVGKHKLQTTAERTTKGTIAAPDVIKSYEAMSQAVGINAPTRVGRFLQKAAGIFKTKPEVVRLLEANDIPVAAHEHGHAVRKGMRVVADAAPPKVKRELERLGKDLYGDKRPSGGYANEGFAELFRIMLTEDAPRSKAPAAYDWMTKDVLAKNAALSKKVTEARNATETWRKQGAMARVEQSIVPSPPAWKQSMRAVQEWLSKEAQIESFEPIRRMVLAAEQTVGRKLNPSADPFLIASWKRGSSGSLTEVMINRSMVNFKGEPVGRPLGDVQALVKGSAGRQKFGKYLVAARAMERWEKGKNPGISLEDASAVFQRLDSPKMRIAAEMYYQWNRGVHNYIKDASPVYGPLLQRIYEGSNFYTPLARVFDPTQTRLRKGESGASSPLKKMEGSGRQIRDPLETTIQNTAYLISAAHKQAVMDRIVKLAREVDGLGRLVEEVPASKVKQVIPIEQLRRSLEELGIDTAGVKGSELVSFFTPAMRQAGKDPIVPYLDGAQVRYFQVEPKIYDALMGMDLYRLPKAVDFLLGKPARLFRLGTTGVRATFGLVTNPLRDFNTFYLQSQFANMPKATAEYFSSIERVLKHSVGGKDPYVDLFYRLNVQLGQPLGMDISYTRRAASELFQGKVFKVAAHPIELLRDLVQIPESVPRIAEMKMMADKLGWKPGEPMTLDQAVQIAMAGKRVTVDFSASGHISKVMNQAIPFYNPSLQGIRSFARAFANNPKKAVMTGLATVTVPTLANWMANKDEVWYRELPWREKFFYHNFQVDDQVIQIPKPHEWGIWFSTLPEMMFDTWYTQDPQGAVEAAKYALDIHNPMDYPVLLKAAKEQWQNRIDFFDRPIVPRGQVDMLPGDQKGEYTTRAAELAGKIAPNHISPRRVDALARAIGGGFASDLLALTGRVGTEEDTERDWEPSDVPVFGRLFRRSGKLSTGALTLNEFYKDLNYFQSAARSVEWENEDAKRYFRLLNKRKEVIRRLIEETRIVGTLEEKHKLIEEAVQLAEETMGERPGR
jgi:hypothetical protein